MTHLRIGLAALVTTAAAAGACATVWLLSSLVGAGGASAVLATVVALSLARREFAGRAEFARSALLLPVIGLGAAGVGWLLTAVPVAGAIVFVAGMSVPVWLRRFGPRAARLGALIALPLTAMLVVPVAPAAQVPLWASALLALVSGVVAVLWVALAREALVLLRVAPPSRATPSARAAPPARSRPTGGAAPPPPAVAASARRGRLPASTRMAIQLAVALCAAFVVGWLVFPAHAIWVVLTAYIVNVGNRGRGDVVHKSVLRVVGALGGSVAAVGLALAAPAAGGFAAVVVIFVALFVGTWLRSYSYAYWALTVTLVLTLLQELFGTSPVLGPGGVAAESGMLAERIAAIVVGAVLGVASAWFILPVRSTDVLRRRLSELLIALAATVAPDADDRIGRLAAFHSALQRVEELAPAHRARRLLGGRDRTQPIDCIDAATAVGAALDARLSARRRADPDARSHLRDAIGQARRSLSAPAELERIRTSLLAVASALDP